MKLYARKNKMSIQSVILIILCRGGYFNGEGLVDYGKRKRVGAGHR
jgi:hypothetical protein